MFDYNDSSVVDKITSILKPGDLVFDCIGGGDVVAKCAEVLSRLGGGALPTVKYELKQGHENVKVEFGKFLNCAYEAMSGQTNEPLC